MGRVLLILLALFAAPTAAWFAWRWLKRPSQQADAALRWQDAPWMWLILGGLVISVAAVLVYGVSEKQDCHPVATQWVDGKLVPAHCE